MQLWVDGDACPRLAKQILFKAAIRTQTKLLLIANHQSQIPLSIYISLIIVPSGFDEADKYISTNALSGDLVITADIPLAADVVALGCIALNPRGTIYDKSNINQQLAVRNLMAQLREQQLVSGGPASYNQANAQALAGQLDKLLSNYHK